MLLRLCDHRGQCQPKGSGNAVCHIQTWIPFAPLDQTDVSVVDVRLLGELLLTQVSCLSMSSNHRAEGQRDATAIRHRGSKMARTIL
jgi:hypothetical protein